MGRRELSHLLEGGRVYDLEQFGLIDGIEHAFMHSGSGGAATITNNRYTQFDDSGAMMAALSLAPGENLSVTRFPNRCVVRRPGAGGGGLSSPAVQALIDSSDDFEDSAAANGTPPTTEFPGIAVGKKALVSRADGTLEVWTATGVGAFGPNPDRTLAAGPTYEVASLPPATAANVDSILFDLSADLWNRCVEITTGVYAWQEITAPSGGGGPADTDALVEGATNLYHTDARVSANATVVANTAAAAAATSAAGVADVKAVAAQGTADTAAAAAATADGKAVTAQADAAVAQAVAVTADGKADTAQAEVDAAEVRLDALEAAGGVVGKVFVMENTLTQMPGAGSGLQPTATVVANNNNIFNNVRADKVDMSGAMVSIGATAAATGLTVAAAVGVLGAIRVAVSMSCSLSNCDLILQLVHTRAAVDTILDATVETKQAADSLALVTFTHHLSQPTGISGLQAGDFLSLSFGSRRASSMEIHRYEVQITP